MDTMASDFARLERTPPPELLGDTIWRLPAYRLSRYLAMHVPDDATLIYPYDRTTADQLERAVHAIGINIAEGHGRLHGRDRARFYEFALSSAREARDWYARTERYLPDGVALGRAFLLTRVIKILTTAIPQERAGSSERRIRAAIRRRNPVTDPGAAESDDDSRNDDARADSMVRNVAEGSKASAPAPAASKSPWHPALVSQPLGTAYPLASSVITCIATVVRRSSSSSLARASSVSAHTCSGLVA